VDDEVAVKISQSAKHLMHYTLKLEQFKVILMSKKGKRERGRVIFRYKIKAENPMPLEYFLQ
jgi:hypothetical protein